MALRLAALPKNVKALGKRLKQMNANPSIILASLLVVLPLFAQQSVDRYMGDWQGEVTINNQTKNVGVYMIPLGDGKYEARFVSDFLQRGPYLYRLKGEIRDGRFRFMDDIPFDVGRVLGTTDRGVGLMPLCGSDPLTPMEPRGTIGGRMRGTFELKQSERVSPQLGKAPPAGAIVLFDGKSLDRGGSRGRQAGEMEDPA